MANELQITTLTHIVLTSDVPHNGIALRYLPVSIHQVGQLWCGIKLPSTKPLNLLPGKRKTVFLLTLGKSIPSFSFSPNQQVLS